MTILLFCIKTVILSSVGRNVHHFTRFVQVGHLQPILEKHKMMIVLVLLILLSSLFSNPIYHGPERICFPDDTIGIIDSWCEHNNPHCTRPTLLSDIPILEQPFQPVCNGKDTYSKCKSMLIFKCVITDQFVC